MSQTISLIDWLRTALSWFFISDIIENMASNASGQLWTCEISFSILVRGSNHRNHIHGMGIQSPDVISAQLSVVRIYLEALRRICYDVLDFSYFKALALNSGDITVPQTSEWFASYNHADVIKWSLIPESWLFVVYYSNNILYFFLFLRMQIALQDLTYAACDLWDVLDQATEQLGYNWDFCNGNLD